MRSPRMRIQSRVVGGEAEAPGERMCTTKLSFGNSLKKT